MNSKIMEYIAQYASASYENQILNSPEYAQFVSSIVMLQEDIKKLTHKMSNDKINVINQYWEYIWKRDLF